MGDCSVAGAIHAVPLYILKQMQYCYQIKRSGSVQRCKSDNNSSIF